MLERRTLVLTVAACVPLLNCTSQPTRPSMASASAARKRVALAIGNGAYRAGVPQLSNPPADAKAVSSALQGLQFDTELLVDADRDSMTAAIARLGQRAANADAAVFYYAGHASEAGGRNLLFPVSVAMDGNGEHLLQAAVSFDEVADSLNGRARTSIMILDSCRDNPFAGLAVPAEFPTAPSTVRGAALGHSRSIGSGLAQVRSAAGALVVFATAPGQVALDGDGEHSPFTAALIHHIGTDRVEVRQMLDLVRRDVREATAGRQTPWDNSSLEQPFYFTAKPNTLLREPPPGTMKGGEMVYVADGTCPPGQVKLLIGGFGTGGSRKRVRSCVAY